MCQSWIAQRAEVDERHEYDKIKDGNDACGDEGAMVHRDPR